MMSRFPVSPFATGSHVMRSWLPASTTRSPNRSGGRVSQYHATSTATVVSSSIGQTRSTCRRGSLGGSGKGITASASSAASARGLGWVHFRRRGRFAAAVSGVGLRLSRRVTFHQRWRVESRRHAELAERALGLQNATGLPIEKSHQALLRIAGTQNHDHLMRVWKKRAGNFQVAWCETEFAVRMCPEPAHRLESPGIAPSRCSPQCSRERFALFRGKRCRAGHGTLKGNNLKFRDVNFIAAVGPEQDPVHLSATMGT